MPYAARLVDSCTISRATMTQSDTGARRVSSYSAVAVGVSCHLQVSGVQAILHEYGVEGKADAVIYFRRGQDVQPKIGAATAMVRDRIGLTDQTGTTTTWQVEGVIEQIEKIGGYTAAIVTHSPGAL